MEKFETERLVMRGWTLDDAEDCYKYCKDPRIGTPSGWKAHESVEESRDVIKQYYFEPEVYAICFKEDRRPIGTIKIYSKKVSPLPELAEDEVEIGYWIGAEHWGKGIATEAAKWAAKRAFQELGMKRVWGRYNFTNPRSGNVLRKVGLKPVFDRVEKGGLTGEDVDVHVVNIDKESWEALTKEN